MVSRCDPVGFQPVRTKTAGRCDKAHLRIVPRATSGQVPGVVITADKGHDVVVGQMQGLRFSLHAVRLLPPEHDALARGVGLLERRDDQAAKGVVRRTARKALLPVGSVDPRVVPVGDGEETAVDARQQRCIPGRIERSGLIHLSPDPQPSLHPPAAPCRRMGTVPTSAPVPALTLLRQIPAFPCRQLGGQTMFGCSETRPFMVMASEASDEVG